MVTNANEQKLFNEQERGRFWLNVKAITGLDQAGAEPGWYQLEPLDEDDKFAYEKDQFMPLLKPLMPPLHAGELGSAGCTITLAQSLLNGAINTMSQHHFPFLRGNATTPY